MKLPNGPVGRPEFDESPQSVVFHTQFLACLEGNHGSCSYQEDHLLGKWICQCECHPRTLPAPDNNYQLFEGMTVPLPRALHHILRYAGVQPNGQPKGLRRCLDCNEWRGLCLASQDPLEWHKGLQYRACACELKMKDDMLSHDAIKLS